MKRKVLPRLPSDCINGLVVLDNAPTDHAPLTHLVVAALREQGNGDRGVTNNLLIQHIEVVDPQGVDYKAVHEILHRLHCLRTGQISMKLGGEDL